MSHDLLRQEIQRLKEFVSEALTPSGVLSHHLQLLIHKLENESALLASATSSGAGTVASSTNISLKFLITKTNSVVVSNLSLSMTTKDLFMKVHVIFLLVT
jgi:hypothetical protein